MKQTQQASYFYTLKIIKIIRFRLFLSVILFLSTFCSFAQTPYPCDKDSIDMATNNLWFSELEKLLPPSTEKLTSLKQNKSEIIAHLKQRINCDTNRVANSLDFSRLCGTVGRMRKQTKDTIYSQSKSSYIPFYVVNGIPIEYKYIHLIINNLQKEQLQSCVVFTDSQAAAFYGTRAVNGVIILNIEPLLLQGNQIVLQKRKNKKNKLVLQLQTKTKLDNVKVRIEPFISLYSSSDTILKPVTYNFKFKKGKNRIVLPRNIRNGLYTIYLNGEKEIVFF